MCTSMILSPVILHFPYIHCTGCAARKVWNVCHYYFILHESLVYEWRWFYYREIEYVVMDDKLMEIF